MSFHCCFNHLSCSPAGEGVFPQFLSTWQDFMAACRGFLGFTRQIKEYIRTLEDTACEIVCALPGSLQQPVPLVELHAQSLNA